MGFDYRSSIGLGKQTLGSHKENIVGPNLIEDSMFSQSLYGNTALLQEQLIGFLGGSWLSATLILLFFPTALLKNRSSILESRIV